MKPPKSHPRFNSLMQRHLIEEAAKKGIAAHAGMIAQGRGEAFDYLLGEKTQKFAKKAISAAAAQLLLAEKPVISVNGNTTALCAKEIVSLAKTLGAKIEVNLFYRSRKRELLIAKEFSKFGAKILGVNPGKKLAFLESKRAFVSSNGIWSADCVLVMLEDGDRTEALRKNGKKVVAVDLNPFSRTAQKADISIVDNVVRCIPLLEKEAKKLKGKKTTSLKKIVRSYSNKKSLSEAINFIRGRTR
ncbi:MAG: phosphopantothenate/pantothenate synthetase [Candidatus Diapherotrites archaeon]